MTKNLAQSVRNSKMSWEHLLADIDMFFWFLDSFHWFIGG